MLLTRHATQDGPRWALDARLLPSDFSLGAWLGGAADASSLSRLATAEAASGELLAPVEEDQEIWASGVTYQRSREARTAESEVKDVYDKVYEAERPELFFKAAGWRAVGEGGAIRVRRDSTWNVPEPELTLVLGSQMQIVGYTAGNDVSSRDIEGENPLYLPQAKVYDGSCAVGAGIQLCTEAELGQLEVKLRVSRAGSPLFEGETSITQMKRSLKELASYLGRELSFPRGALLMTGTGIVPGDDFNLQPGDVVRVQVGQVVLTNSVSA